MWSVGKPVARGFTLLELLVVLAILGLSLVFAIPGFRPAALTLPREGAALTDVLAQARGRALATGRPVAVHLDADARGYRLGNAQAIQLAQGTRLAAETSAGARLPELWFYPDGTSDGGVLTLERSGRQWRVSVDWLTGRVRHDGG